MISCMPRISERFSHITGIESDIVPMPEKTRRRMILRRMPSSSYASA